MGLGASANRSRREPMASSAGPVSSASRSQRGQNECSELLRPNSTHSPGSQAGSSPLASDRPSRQSPAGESEPIGPDDQCLARQAVAAAVDRPVVEQDDLNVQAGDRPQTSAEVGAQGWA